MKKNRASFFNEQIDYASYNTNQYNNQYPNNTSPMMQAANIPQMPMMPNMSAQSSFYAGMPPMQNQMNVQPQMQNQTEDIEFRLAKIERQLSRLDHRLSKIEGQGTINTSDLDSNINDLYMI